MNRKGSKVLAVYWFAILVIVAIGIYAMISAYYNHPIDVREWEAEILSNKVADCISRQGTLNLELVDNEEFNDNFKENFLSECDLNLESEWDKNQYYIGVDFFTVDNREEAFFIISAGDTTWKEQYSGIQEVQDYSTLPKGIKKRFYAVDNQNNQFLIEVLSIVKKTEKNVKA